MRFNRRILWERGYPYLITVCLLAIVFVLSHSEYLNQYTTNEGILILNSINEKLFSDEIFNCVLTIESIIFGFLLAVLALTIQSNSQSILELKKANRFDELITYNRHSVICAFGTIILTVVLLLLGEYIEGVSCGILKYVWSGSFILSLFLTYRFLDIFYTISKR